MKTGNLLSLHWALMTLLSHWRRHPVQLVTWIVGLLLATALWSGVQALNTQARDSYARAAQVFEGADQAALVAQSGQAVPQQAFADLRRLGWPVAPVLEGRVRLGGRYWSVLGIDPITLPMDVTAARAVVSGEQRLGQFMTLPGLTLVAPDTHADLADLDEPRQTESGQLLPPFQVADGLPPGTLVMDIGHAQRVLQQPEAVTRLLLTDPDWSETRALPPAWADQLRRQAGQSEDDLTRLTDSFHLNLTALGLLAFLVGLFIVHGATGLAFEQRRGLFRTLRACGVSAAVLILSLFLELLVLALVAGSFGLILGYLVAAFLLPDVAASLGGLYGAQVAGSLALGPGWWLSGLAMSLVGALLASAGSLWHAVRLPVLALGAPQAWQRAQRLTIRGQTIGGLILLASGGLWLRLGEGLVMGFAVVGALMLGTALLLPAFLVQLLRLGERRARTPVWQWFWADARQQVSGISLALMALMLALAANIGIGGMVESFRTTFNGWLDQRLAAEVYVRAQDATQAEALANWLSERQDINAVMPTGQLSVRLDGLPVEVNGISVHATYRNHWPVLTQTPDAWDQLARGEGVLVSEQLARQQNLALGDGLSLPTTAGASAWSLRVVGVYADYGNPRGQMLVALNRLRNYGDLTNRGFSVRINPDQANQLVADVRQEFALGTQEAIDQAAVKAYSSVVFDRTFVATGALNTLTLAVAGVALLTSLLTLSHSRLPQLAPVWALGVPLRTLARMEWQRTLMLALLTAVLAIPLGLALAWCLVAVINVEAFGWRLPLYFFPGQWAVLLMLAAVTAVLATAWPIWQLHRRPISEWIKVFAHE